MYKHEFPPEVRKQARIEAKHDIGLASHLNDDMIEFVKICHTVAQGRVNDEETIATLAKNMLDNDASQTQLVIMWAEAINRLAKAEIA